MRQIFQMSFPPPRDLVLYNINTTESIVITPQHLDKEQHLLAPTAFLLCHLIPTVLKKPDVSARGSWISIHNKMTRLPSRLPCNWPGHWSWLLTPTARIPCLVSLSKNPRTRLLQSVSFVSTFSRILQWTRHWLRWIRAGRMPWLYTTAL